MERFSRTAALFGDEAIDKLRASSVAVFGIGGVGGYAAEALARSGIGKIYLIDSDTVSVSNINRQIIALSSTVGEDKVEIMRRRIMDINPEASIIPIKEFFSPESSGKFNFKEYDYVIDAIDSVSGKIELVMRAKAAGVPIISAMGAGNKTDAAAFEVADIYKTSVCPLARVMRAELKRRGVKSLKVVYSKEPPKKSALHDDEHRPTPASAPYVPGVVGLIMAGEVIKDILKK